MQFPSNQNAGSLNLTPQQYNTLINLLAQQPQASPTSTTFDPNYYSRLAFLQNQQLNQAPQQANQQYMNSGQQPSYIVVRTVDDPSMIGPQEVSMGTCNLFPSNDKQHIFVKTWNNKGLIEDRVYALQNEIQKADVTEDAPIGYSELNKRIDELEKELASAMASIKDLKNKSSKPKPKAKPVVKEDSTDLNGGTENG